MDLAPNSSWWDGFGFCPWSLSHLSCSASDFLRFGKHARPVCDGFVDRPVAGRTLWRISVDLLALSWLRPINRSLGVRVPTDSIFLSISLSCYEADWKDLVKCFAKILTYLGTDVGMIRLDGQKTRIAGSVSRINQCLCCLWFIPLCFL